MKSHPLEKKEELTKWERIVRDSIIRKEKIREERERRLREERLREKRKKLKRYLSIPIIIGLLACVLFIYRFGWTELEKSVYSWLIGITFISTLVASFWRNK